MFYLKKHAFSIQVRFIKFLRRKSSSRCLRQIQLCSTGGGLDFKNWKSSCTHSSSSRSSRAHFSFCPTSMTELRMSLQNSAALRWFEDSEQKKLLENEQREERFLTLCLFFEGFVYLFHDGGLNRSWILLPSVGI